MDGIMADVKTMLLNHEEIDTNQTLIVNFNAFGASSLDFFIYTFTKTTQWVRYHEIKQDVLLKVLNIIHEHGADCAFPTRTLHLDSMPAGMMAGNANAAAPAPAQNNPAPSPVSS